MAIKSWSLALLNLRWLLDIQLEMLGRQQVTHTTLELRGKVRANMWSYYRIDDIWSHKIRWDHQSWEYGYRRVRVKHRAGGAGLWTECKVDSWKLKKSDSSRLLKHRMIEDLKASVLPHSRAPTPVLESKVASEPHKHFFWPLATE